MEILKRIIEYIIMFILVAVITILTIVNIISLSILKEDYILSKLETTGYYEEMYKHVKDNFENYIGQSGLEEHVFENIITKEKLQNDIKQIIDNIYNGTNKEIEVKEIEDNLSRNINKELEGQRLSEDEQKSIDIFIESICNEYKTSILHTEHENEINNMYKQVIKYKYTANRILLILALVCEISLLLLNWKYIIQFFIEIGGVMFAVATFLICTKIYINMRIKIQNIVLFNEAFEKTMRTILTDILNNVSKYGIILLVVGLVVMVVFEVIKHKKEK